MFSIGISYMKKKITKQNCSLSRHCSKHLTDQKSESLEEMNAYWVLASQTGTKFCIRFKTQLKEMNGNGKKENKRRLKQQ